MSIRTIIADDHPMMRRAIRQLLAGQGDIDVVGEAADGQEALELVRRHRPDVLVTDMSMPRLNGLALIQGVAALAARTQTLAVSMYSDATIIRKALEYGAGGYVVKESMVGHLALAIRSAYVGNQYLCPLAQQALQAQGSPPAARA